VNFATRFSARPLRRPSQAKLNDLPIVAEFDDVVVVRAVRPRFFHLLSIRRRSGLRQDYDCADLKEIAI
jgi:hypothetical protein